MTNTAIKVGMIAEQTGPLSFMGCANANVAKMVIDDINASGGLLGRKLDLYLEDKKPVRMADTKATMDRLIVRPDDPNKLLWWWCDALFMSPPVLLRMYEITHDKKYLDYMDHEWWLTSGSLYNQENHLYFRDSRYFTQKQANGKPIFWSRGNGWVMGALVNVLRLMPADYPSRPKYDAQFREMAAEIAA